MYDLASATQEKAGLAKGACDEGRLFALIDGALAQLLGTTEDRSTSLDAFGRLAEARVKRAEDTARRARIDREREALVAAAHVEQRDAQWAMVAREAHASTVAISRRIASLDRFITAFPSDGNPYRPLADFYLSALRAGNEPSSAVRWIRSRPASLDFSISEITVAQFRRCIEEGGCEQGAVATRKDCNWAQPDRDDHPINCVTWSGAQAFCRWTGGRLPTEDEWHMEATNGGGSLFPWGLAKATCRSTVMHEGRGGCGKKRTWPVCRKPRGHSVSGLCDVSGNVWEWTATAKDGEFVIRGGGWKSKNHDNLQSTARTWRPPYVRLSTIGFRCARSTLD